MSRGALRSSYRDVDPTQPCPECHAGPGIWCSNPITGKPRRVPCVRRPRIPRLEPGVSDLHRSLTDQPQELDFSEPRHPNEFAAAHKAARSCTACSTELRHDNTHTLCAECQLAERNPRP